MFFLFSDENLIMSTEHETDHSSPPLLHFIPKIHTTQLASNHNNENTPPSIVDENPTPNEQSDDNKPIKTVSHSRRVHFPTDDSQLRIFSYSTDPFSNRPLLSLGVILQRYRGACQRLQIRPLNCLLDQLSTMDDGRKTFADRLDCLKIVNEKLDMKQIEALEEILSRCRFHTIDFDSSNLDESAFIQLFDILEYYESCTHINFSNNRTINYQGYQALTKYLRKTNCLERLDMNSMRFDESNIVTFTRSLRLSSTLYELHVESCQLNGKILLKFIENVRSCASLRELYLCDNRIQVQDANLISNLIRTCGATLYSLDLRSNAIQDQGMSYLASQFSHYDVNHTDESNLCKISFQANQLTQEGVGFLAKSLLHNRTIRSLNLSHNPITNEGFFLLRDALLTNRTINELILQHCRLTDQAAIALAEFIAESSTIQYIDLRGNRIQASGICGIAIAIKNNKSLLRLDFDPIVATPTNVNSLFSTNNIDRTANINSLLSISNIRRMTTSLTGHTSFQITPGGGGTRELLEQKARWMNDIAAVCQRNLLIYEEKLRVQEEEQQQQPDHRTTDGNNTTTVKSEDVELKEEVVETHPTDNESVEEPLFTPTNDEITDEQEINITTNDEDELTKDPVE